MGAHQENPDFKAAKFLLELKIFLDKFFTKALIMPPKFGGNSGFFNRGAQNVISFL
jgi:hypothetical protein